MISKKKLSNAQRLTLVAIDAAEWTARLMPAIIGLASVALIAGLVQREINKEVAASCPKSISVVVEHPTAVGPSFQCVSRAQLQGPAQPLKP